MDSRNDEYFDEETGEVMSSRENNMAASDSADSADERITNQNNVDKNGNSTPNSVLKSTEGVSEGSEISLDDNVNNVSQDTVSNANLGADADAEADGSSRSSASGKRANLGASADAEADGSSMSSASGKRVTPVDSAGTRHFRVTKSSPSGDSSPCGGPVKPKVPFSSSSDDSSPCGGPVKPRVTFSANSCEKDNDSATLIDSSNSSCTGSMGAQSLPVMDVDHCEQTTRPPNVIHVSDSDYSEDVLIQYGVDPYKWMYPKDLARPEKSQSPVPFHNDSDLTDSEILTQFCWGPNKGLTGAQSKPRRTGHSDASETQTGLHVVPSDQSVARPGQPRKVIITENERFRVPPKLKTSEESCGKKSDKNKCEVNNLSGRGPLPGRRAGMIRAESGEGPREGEASGRRAEMIRTESGESETGESKNKKTVMEDESNNGTTSGAEGGTEGGAEGWNWSDCDMDKQYSEYIKYLGTSTDQFVQTDDASGEDIKCTCTCPQCGHGMKLCEETQDETSPQAGETTQEKEDVCSCDHTDKGPDWHAVFMCKMFKMHAFMMSRGGRHPSPFHNVNQGAQRPPFPPPPWMRPPWSSWRAGGCPPGACRGPWQRFCGPWAKPPESGDNSPHGTDKPHDVPETGAC